MRVLASFLIVAVVLQGAFAVSSKSTQSKLLIQKIGATLEKSHLGRALKNMVHLASKLGYDYSDLYTALGDLKTSLLTTKNDEESSYARESIDHEGLVNYFNSAIAGYTEKLGELHNKLESLNNELSDAEHQLAKQQDDYSNSQDALHRAESNLNNLRSNYNAEQNEYNDALGVLAQAISSLEQSQSHYQNAELGGYSFVQLTKEFVSFSQQIESKTSTFAKRHQLHIKPVVQMMAQMTAETEQSSIERAIEALRDLETYFRDSLNQLTQSFVELEALYETQISYETAVSDQLLNVDIPNTQQNIERIQGEIVGTQDQIAANEAALADATAKLAEENQRWEVRTQQHNARINKLNEEYQIVESAEQIVRQAEANLVQ